MSADKKVHDADAFRKQLALAERVLCRLNENGSHMGRQIGIVNDNFEGKVGNYSAGEVILFRTGGGIAILLKGLEKKKVYSLLFVRLLAFQENLLVPCILLSDLHSFCLIALNSFHPLNFSFKYFL